MNRYERYLRGIGFTDPVLLKTKAPLGELRALAFGSLNHEAVAKALGKYTAFNLNWFFYKITPTKCIAVDTAKKVVFLGNSARAVKALAKTVNKPV